MEEEEQFVMKNISTPRTSKSSKKVQVLSPQGSGALKIRDKYVGSKYSLKYPNCKTDCTTSEKDEIIKYMSSLPCYLQHPQKYGSQNKALNFGVLDWSLLEDWKHNQEKAAGQRSSSKTKLPSASDPSASFTNSRRSSAEQRRETLGTLGPCECLSSSRAKHVKVSAENHTNICYSKVHTECSHRRDKRNQEMDQTLGSMGLDSQKMKMKFWDNENSLKRQSFSVSKEVCAPRIKCYDFLSSPEEPKTQDVFSCFIELPRDPSVLNQPSRISKGDYLVNSSNDCSLTSSAAHAEMAADLRGTSLLSTSHSPRTSSADPHHKNQPSHVLRQKDLKGSREGETALGLLSERRRKVSSHRRETQPKPTCSNSCTENNSMPSDFSASNKHVDPLHGQVGHNKEQANEADPSAIDVSSLLIDTTSRSLGFTEGIVTRPSCSGIVVCKSDPVKLDVPTNEDDGSSTDQIKTDCKRQPGPLWRMLIPLVKSRARNYVQSSSQQKHEAASICKSLLPELSLAAHEGCKTLCEKLPSVCDETTEKTSALLGQQSADPADNLVDKEPMSVAQHALLQIISKNGIPSFLFSFNNHSDSFAAIERKISINGKKTLHWMYTFYAVTGIKKRTGWIKQGKNEDKHWHVSSVVGQMEASCFLFPQLTRGGISESSLIMEYVLSGVRNTDPSPGKSDCKIHVDDPMLEINSCNELAAVIIKTTSGPVKIGAKQDGDNDSEGTFFTEKSACDGYSSLDDNLSKKENLSCDCVKVILPSGLHGVPANEVGMPSLLIDRWRSGGSCDCGGWDEGCSLTILDNQVPQSKRSLSFSQALVDANVPQQVDLFVQGAQGVTPALRFATIHEGLYSIDFDASISSLQAFSVGIAILHSRSHAITSGTCTEFLLESLLATQEGRFHMPNRFQGTGSLKSILDPPLSPVGRA